MEIKLEALHDILNYVTNGHGIFNSCIYSEILSMISLNIFRKMPKTLTVFSYWDDTTSSLTDASWTHLHVVYKIAIASLESQPSKGFIKYFDKTFIGKLLETFDTDNQQEREYLKRLLHRICATFPQLRASIRNQIGNMFLTFTYELDNFNGIAELLEVISSLIHGYAVPLKPEHNQFLIKILLPMHKVNTLHMFHIHLVECVMHFIEKDVSLAPVILMELLKMWPKTCSHKEVLFVVEIEDIMLMMNSVDFRKVAVPVSKIIAQAMCSQHYQVAVQALSLWSNSNLLQLIEDNKDIILPIILPALITHGHWNQSVVALISEIQKKVKQINAVTR